MSRVELAIPARPEFVGVVRLVVTSLARSIGLDEDRVDDLKIAVSEVCTNAIGSSESAPIAVEWSSDADSATVQISGSGAMPEEEVDGDSTAPRGTFSNDLLQALLDSYEVDRGPDGSTARLTVTLT